MLPPSISHGRNRLRFFISAIWWCIFDPPYPKLMIKLILGWSLMDQIILCIKYQLWYRNPPIPLKPWETMILSKIRDLIRIDPSSLELIYPMELIYRNIEYLQIVTWYTNLYRNLESKLILVSRFDIKYWHQTHWNIKFGYQSNYPVSNIRIDIGSSNVSNPELAPNTAKWGVQICAGINFHSSQPLRTTTN